MLTRYDEFPIHQTPYPFAESNITDYSFDDGYFFSVFCADADLFLMTGMRVNQNTDMIGGYAGVMFRGQQYTARFSREWRPDCDTYIGPLRYSFDRPFEDIHLTLGDNDSELRFDIHWIGVSRAYEEEHHLAWSRGRRTTDQTRYSQSGVGLGWIEFRGQRFEVSPATGWYASRDHSWGLYAERAPLAPARKWLPPREVPAVRRALRFWTNFGQGQEPNSGPRFSGFYHLHESEDGEQVRMNDTFGTPFDGGIDWGPDGRHLRLVSGSHRIEFRPGTRIMERAHLTLTDEEGGTWQQLFEPAGQPWNPHPIGYGPGSWKDGGSMYTYHGPGVQQEWDSFDWSVQPYAHTAYDGRVMPIAYGVEYLSRVTTTAPDGTVSRGAAHTELFLDGRYTPYGFEASDPPSRPHSSS